MTADSAPTLAEREAAVGVLRANGYSLKDALALLSPPSEREIERLRRAVRFASGLIDGIFDSDMHEEAFTVALERDPDADDTTEDDYAEAFMRIADRALTAPPEDRNGE